MSILFADRSNKTPILGIDLDNTLVCFDSLFYEVGCEKEWIPETLRNTKQAIKGFLRQNGYGDRWTLLQGEVYGDQMHRAKPFPHALDVIREIISLGVECYIISHRSRYPYLGPRYDLHKAAWVWLEENGFLELLEEQNDLKVAQKVLLNESLDKKVAAIGLKECHIFVDDLTDVFQHPSFPAKTISILFDAQNTNRGQIDLNPKKNWLEIGAFIKKQCLMKNCTV